ncbi:MAG: aminodeoxychorismate lyase [Marinobacter sp. 34-60-7]|nr:MAG: aminodeoxychorismate lyase [Marinobacter sp. 34-60-7]
MFRVFWAEECGPPAGDRGLAYGDGLFETLRVETDRVPLLAYHLDRLVKDAARLGIPLIRGELEVLIHQAIERYATPNTNSLWVLKLIVTRGAGGRGYQPAGDLVPHLVVSRSDVPPATDAAGVHVDFSPVPLVVHPLLAGMKSLNRLEQVLAARGIQGKLFEVLMSNTDGDVVEGTRTNVFLATQEGWQTPPSRSLAVSGVMRRVVLERLLAAGEPVREAPLQIGDLLSDRCQGLFLTNSVLGVVPVRTLAGQDLPVSQRLATICRSPATLG